MVILITGGSGSGKSAYAENYISNLCRQTPPNYQMYYLATMRVYGAEGKAKVARHRAMRAGKGFVTLEQTTDIQQSLKQTHTDGGKTAILLECMSNLVANEMFTEDGITEETVVVDKILSGIHELKDGAAHLVIVTNNVFEDGVAYDRETMSYIRALGSVNQRLAKMADEVWEVLAGIPLQIK